MRMPLSWLKASALSSILIGCLACGNGDEKSEGAGVSATKSKEQETTKKPFKALELPDDPEQRVQVLLDHAIEVAGGLDAWKAIETIDFRVLDRNYNLKNGNMMWEMTQRYFLRPHEHRYRVEDYTEGGNPNFMVFDGREGFMKVEGKLLRNVESREEAREDLLTEARYMTMPFALLAPDVELEYEGPGEYEGARVQRVRALFRDGLKSRIEPDRYEVFFDAQTGAFLGLRHLVVIQAQGKERLAQRNLGYVEFAEQGGVLFPLVRVQFGENASLERPRVTRHMSEFHVNGEYEDYLFAEPSEGGEDPFYRANLARVKAEHKARRAKQDAADLEQDAKESRPK